MNERIENEVRTQLHKLGIIDYAVIESQSIPESYDMAFQMDTWNVRDLTGYDNTYIVYVDSHSKTAILFIAQDWFTYAKMNARNIRLDSGKNLSFSDAIPSNVRKWKDVYFDGYWNMDFYGLTIHIGWHKCANRIVLELA